MATKKQKEARAKWIEALKSGKYKQGKYALRNTKDEFCCLGVATDLFKRGRGKWVKNEADATIYKFNPKGEEPKEMCFLPTSLKSVLGLATTYGTFEKSSLPKELQRQLKSFSEETNLSVLNDQGCSFDLIADVIKAEPKGLFEKD